MAGQNLGAAGHDAEKQEPTTHKLKAVHRQLSNLSDAMVRTKSGGNRAVSPEFVIPGVIFYPSRVES
jgi:hypothetical protein